MPILPPLAAKCLLALLAAVGVAVGAAGGLSPIGEQISVSIRMGARCVPVVGEVGLTRECVREWWATTSPRSRDYPHFVLPHEYDEFDLRCPRWREHSEECLTHLTSFNGRGAPSPSH